MTSRSTTCGASLWKVEALLSVGSLDDFIGRLEHGFQGSPDTGFVIDEEDTLLDIRLTAVF